MHRLNASVCFTEEINQDIINNALFTSSNGKHAFLLDGGERTAHSYCWARGDTTALITLRRLNFWLKEDVANKNRKRSSFISLI